MKRRLATICVVMMLLSVLASSSTQAQSKTSLKGISALCVLVEDLPTGGKRLGLTEEAIQTDVELKLRLAGMRVVTEEESFALPGMPDLYVRVTLTDSAEAAVIELELDQLVRLKRDDQLVVKVPTWQEGTLIPNPSAQVVRNKIKDLVDQFLNDWLSVNPKK